MSIRATIIMAQLLMIAAAALMLLVSLLADGRSRQALTHWRASTEQLYELVTLARRSNLYGEQFAELILLGPAGLDRLHAVRSDVHASLDTLERKIRNEMGFTEAAARSRELDELDSIRRLRLIYAALDERSAVILDLVRDDRQADAVRLFEDEIEGQLDRELKAILGHMIGVEEREVAESLAAADRLRRHAYLSMVGAAVLACLISAAAAVLLYRRLSWPISLLIEGAEAIGRGHLGHRIGYRGSHEFERLSQRFDAMARELGGQRARLEDEVRARTAELETANARLREVDRNRVQFLANISHELRTPLTVIRGEAEVSLRGRRREPAPLARALERILAKAEQTSDLVDDLLLLARSEAGVVRLDRAPIVLQEVVQAAIGDAELLRSRQDLTIVRRLPATSLEVLGDPQWLKRAITIGLDNSVKYSPQGGEIEVELRRSGTMAELTIRDQGLGIAADEIPRAFDRFYRGRDPRIRASRGSGLGLPIAKWIADEHGGVIDLRSDPGHTTELVLCIPVADNVEHRNTPG